MCHGDAWTRPTPTTDVQGGTCRSPLGNRGICRMLATSRPVIHDPPSPLRRVSRQPVAAPRSFNVSVQSENFCQTRISSSPESFLYSFFIPIKVEKHLEVNNKAIRPAANTCGIFTSSEIHSPLTLPIRNSQFGRRSQCECIAVKPTSLTIRVSVRDTKRL